MKKETKTKNNDYDDTGNKNQQQPLPLPLLQGTDAHVMMQIEYTAIKPELALLIFQI